jgi:putative restriction endonuclease
LGQEELSDSEVESVVEREFKKLLEGETGVKLLETEKHLAQTLRIGQHRFAGAVLTNCKNQCIFCGFSLLDRKKPTLLLAGHIKPWKLSTNEERLDFRNGVAACPSHDAAFDAGLITLEFAENQVIVTRSSRLNKAIALNKAAYRQFGPDGIRDWIPDEVFRKPPHPDFLYFHNMNIYHDSMKIEKNDESVLV